MKSKSSKKENLELTCLWRGCEFAPTSSLPNFSDHVVSHVRKEEQVCMWLECDEEFEDVQHLARHLSYHAHHEHLLTLGREFAAEQKLQVRVTIMSTREYYTILYSIG
jgi:hypothetical protein